MLFFTELRSDKKIHYLWHKDIDSPTNRLPELLDEGYELDKSENGDCVFTFSDGQRYIRLKKVEEYS